MTASATTTTRGSATSTASLPRMRSRLSSTSPLPVVVLGGRRVGRGPVPGAGGGAQTGGDRLAPLRDPGGQRTTGARGRHVDSGRNGHRRRVRGGRGGPAERAVGAAVVA